MNVESAVPGVFGVTDPFDCGDTQAVGSGDVYVNFKKVARLGDLTAGHVPFPPVPIDTASATVFVNNVGIARAKGALFPGDSHTPHVHPGRALVGSVDVFADDGPNAALFINTIAEGQVQDQPVPADYLNEVPEVRAGASYLLAATTFTDDEESDNSQGLAVYPPPPAGTPPASYIITSRSIGVVQGAAPPTTIELAPPPSGAPPSIFLPDCSDIYDHVGVFPGNFVLSPNFTLAMLTTETFVSNVQLRAQAGLTQKDIVCNLRQLCVNILEKLFELYPTKDWRVNSGFRQASLTDSGKISQHGLGQAVDVEFLNMTKSEKYEFARDFLQNDINFDQFIFETKGGPSTWFHFSYKGDENRRSILTSARPSDYKSGIHKIA